MLIIYQVAFEAKPVCGEQYQSLNNNPAEAVPGRLLGLCFPPLVDAQFASIKITRVTPALLNRRSREARQSGHFTSLIRDSSFRDYLDLFKFRSFEAKKFRHLDDLIRTDEIGGLSAESVDTGGKLAALHCFRDFQTEAASTFRRVKQTEFANNHFSLHFCCRSPWFALNNTSALRLNGSAAIISYE